MRGKEGSTRRWRAGPVHGLALVVPSLGGWEAEDVNVLELWKRRTSSGSGCWRTGSSGGGHGLGTEGSTAGQGGAAAGRDGGGSGGRR